MNLPNKLTMLRMVLIPVFLLCFVVGSIPNHYLWALVIFAIASLTDLADGKIARSRGLITDFGKLMDPLADKLLVMSAMIGFVAVEIVSPVIVVLILSREFLVTAIRQIAASKGTVIAADKWGKMKTVAQMTWICLGLLLLAVGELAGAGTYLIWGAYAYRVLLVAVVALTVISGLRYLWANRALFADA